mmetsp:Transcript_17731/g.37037  ORF Transcript_17731/g.37037 Transcript_17731/m.37037 type:complete len:285 (-) Transcript_17731:238-1092(-)
MNLRIAVALLGLSTVSASFHLRGDIQHGRELKSSDFKQSRHGSNDDETEYDQRASRAVDLYDEVCHKSLKSDLERMGRYIPTVTSNESRERVSEPKTKDDTKKIGYRMFETKKVEDEICEDYDNLFKNRKDCEDECETSLFFEKCKKTCECVDECFDDKDSDKKHQKFCCEECVKHDKRRNLASKRDGLDKALQSCDRSIEELLRAVPKFTDEDEKECKDWCKRECKDECDGEIDENDCEKDCEQECKDDVCECYVDCDKKEDEFDEYEECTHKKCDFKFEYDR